jgi:hypothetical protein
MTVAPLLSQSSALHGRSRQVVVISTRISLLGVLCSVGLVVALHLLRPDLNPVRHFVSDYAVGPYHTLMMLAFSACSVGLLALALSLYHGVSPAGRSWPGLVLLTISGLSIGVAACFQDKPQTSPAVLLDTVHDSIIQVGLMSLALSALAWALRFRKDARWRAVAWPALLLAVLMLAGLLGFMLTPQRLMGLAERGLLILYLLWVCGVLIRLAVLASGSRGSLPDSVSAAQRLQCAKGVRERGKLPARSWHSPEGQAPSSP